MSLKTELRSGINWLRWIGAAFTFGGALSLIVGGILPWARFRLLGTEIGIPGAVEWGAVTLTLGLLTLSVGALRRRLPLLVMVMGFVALSVGFRAREETGKQVRGRLLALENSIAPVNARLAQVALPPIEPFGAGLGRSQDYIGPGPLWTIAGGAALAVGGTLTFIGGRLGRSCRHCGALWRTGRLVSFCPACGTLAATTSACIRCWGPLEGGDRFCAACGTATGASVEGDT